MRAALKSHAAGGDDRVLSGVFAELDPVANEPFVEFRKCLDTLATDAGKFLQDAQLPPRPEVPRLPRDASSEQIIRSLYARSNGLVLGEGHAQLGSKAFLIDNMVLLKKQKVKVLYMEHFMTDFQQADMEVFNRTGQMPKDLQEYVADLDQGHGTDPSGRYTFKQVLMAAQRQGIRIQSIDCLASYRQAWSATPAPYSRQKMMNYFAHLTIDADQAARGSNKWIALVGNTHSSTFNGVPGVSELQGTLGLRIEDIEIGKLGGIDIDPGLSATNSDNVIQHVQGDLRLQLAVTPLKASSVDLESTLPRIGMFTFQEIDGQLNLIHRSNDGRLKYTPVQQQGGYLHIDKADWPWISGRRQDSLGQLRAVLTRHGLNYVRS
jgi:hypothetical protein